MTLVLDRPEIDVDDLTDDDSGNGYRHYFTKDDLDRNLFESVPIRAFCGYIRRGLANPASDLPVCAKCKWLYENVMQPGDDEGSET